MAVFRKRRENIRIPSAVEVLWGDEVAGVRRIMETDDKVGDIRIRLAAHPSKNLYERDKLTSGDWILKIYRGLTTRQCIEIKQSTATLVSGVLKADNDTELIEE